MTTQDKSDIREALFALLIFIAAILCICFADKVFGAELLRGTVLVSRNADERLNTSLGFWNHLAIVVNDKEIIEEQAGLVENGQGRGVIRTQLSDYLNRDYTPVLALKPRDEAAGERAANRAEAEVGLANRNASSLFRRNGPRRQAKGVNCVTAAAEIPYGPENPRIRGIVKPDGIFRFKRTFKPPETIVP